MYDEISYIKLTIGLFIALTLSGLIVDEVGYHVSNIRAEKAAKELAKKLKDDRLKEEVRLLEQAKAQREKNRAVAQEKERKRAIDNQLRKTCDFWIKEYRKTRESSDRIHRDNACKKAGITIK